MKAPSSVISMTTCASRVDRGWSGPGSARGDPSSGYVVVDEHLSDQVAAFFATAGGGEQLVEVEDGPQLERVRLLRHGDLQGLSVGGLRLRQAISTWADGSCRIRG